MREAVFYVTDDYFRHYIDFRSAISDVRQHGFDPILYRVKDELNTDNDAALHKLAVETGLSVGEWI